METKHYPHLGEQVIYDALPNGLQIAIVPRRDFSKKLAYFVTDYGAIHTDFTLNGAHFTAPQGVAHYLEHKLFDMPDGRDVSAEFAALGANVNAFTSYDMTAYYFSCTENFSQCLALLLEFVSTPYFTHESVQKEQGIIGQEIDMNEDAPDTKVFELLMQAMYREHPIRYPILGTRKTIAQITPELLTQCHKAFYAPENMLLCIIGDVDVQAVRKIALAKLPEKGDNKLMRQRNWDEAMRCVHDLVESRMDIAMPMFQIGFKCEPIPNGTQGAVQEIIGDLAAEALFGESSCLYLQLYEQGLIDASFGGGFEAVEGMAMLSLSGESEHPEKIRDAVIAQAQVLVNEGISDEDFLRMKRSAMGRRICALDSFDSTAFRICAYHFSKFDYFDFPQLYVQVALSDIQAFLKRVVTPERCCLSIIRPHEQEETKHE